MSGSSARSLPVAVTAALVLATLLALVATAAPAAAASAPPTRGHAFAGTEPAGERVVGDTTAYPARAVGTLDTVLGGEPVRCAAFLIDRNSVLTAAHCVHDGSGDTPDAWATAATFDPGHDAGTTPFRTCAGTGGQAPFGWRRAADERVDYAVVHLDCGIGRRVGWFGLWLSGKGEDLVGREVRVRGYPADLGGSQWRGGGRVTGVTPRLVFHNARTSGDVAGGGPVYVSSTACGGPCAVAVQADEPHGGVGVHGRAAHGPRLTVGRFGQILAWAAENG